MKQRCFTVRQPWASLIIAGVKPILNAKGYKRFRGRCYIHAAKTIDKEGFEWMKSNLNPKIYDNLEFKTGGIIGHVNITNCLHRSNSPWFLGPNGFVLQYPTQIAFHPCKGRPGFFSAEVPF